jgi:hypothetical protein
MYCQQLGRFASRDPVVPNEEWNRHAYTRNNPTNRVDPMGKLSLVIGTPMYYFCGLGRWPARFVPNKDEQEGYIVQKVKTYWYIKACARQAHGPGWYRASAKCPQFETRTPSGTSLLVYWEYWRVTSGNVNTPLPSNYHDLFQSVGLNTKETFGTYEQSGLAAFFPGKDPPRADWRVDPSKPTGLLHYSCTAPEGWDSARKAVYRAWSFRWICCCDGDILEPKTDANHALPRRGDTTGRGWWDAFGLEKEGAT